MENQTLLKMENVSKIFPRIENNGITHALDTTNLELGNNEFVCIVGSSGCGKSTILRLVAGLITPTKGKITVNREEIKKPDTSRGMVFQEPTLFPWLTVEDNISFSLKMQKTYNKNKDKVDKMIKLIGLEDFRNDYPHQLSGGMAQRVSLVRSLINEPEILLLDEPLGALDAFTRMNMQDEILNMWKKSRQLVVMVTHDVEEAVYMGTKVIVMEAHPGSIYAQVPIDLDYPRNRGSDEFMVYRNKILSMLNN